jgi:hypothetical protein
MAYDAIQDTTPPAAQPAQEPVAWMREDATLKFAEGKVFAVGQPFYTTPQQRQPLSVEDVRKAGGIVHKDGNIFFTNIGQMNAALGITAIKAALAQECPNLKNCKGACFQCEYFNVDTGMMEYPAAQPVHEGLTSASLVEIDGNARRILIDALKPSCTTPAKQEPVAWLETLKGLASSCPELHKRIYHAHEVDRLEDWAATVLTCIDGIKETTE